MKQKLLSFLVLCSLLIGVAHAQQRTVTGRVTSSEDGSAIVGASVTVINARTATQTGADGHFTLNVEPNQTIRITSVGYEAQEINLGNQTNISIQLAVSSSDIEEIMVVGYGTTTREAFTGSAKRISAENIEAKRVNNISQAIAGEVAGTGVMVTSGQPGTAATVRIRGFGSVNGNRSPLYVLDGLPFNGDITTINNNDIESVTVLKDAVATSIYGSRGANGVILINTKTGRQRGGGSFVDADISFGTNAALLPRYDVIKSPEEYIGYSWESLYNVAPSDADPVTYANNNLFEGSGLGLMNNIWNINSVADLIDPTTRTVRSNVTRKWSPEVWEDYAFQSAARRDYNVRFGGSSETANYYTSLGYLKDEGYSINSDFERFSGRINVDNRVKSWLSTGINLGFARSTRNNAGQSSDSGSIFWFVDNIPSIYPLFERDENGDPIPDLIYGGYRYDYGENNARRFGSMTNSISDAHNSTRRHTRSEVNARGYINFNIIDGLTLENSLGVDYYHNRYDSQNSKFYGSSVATNGSITQQRTERGSYNLLNLLRYRNQFNEHSIEAFAAHEAQNFKNNVMTGTKNQLVRDDIPEFDNAVVMAGIGSYTAGYTLESYFGQVNYDFDKRYFFTGSLRSDGSSRFVNQKWGTSWALGGSWNITSEAFMQDQTVLDFLRLKASYGLNGDQSVGAYYPGLLTYEISNLNNSPSIGNPFVGNPDLTWEFAKMFQTGVDFSFGQYLSGTVEYYVKNTDNLIFDRRVGPSQGIALLKVNDGALRNSGLEFDLTSDIIKTQDWRFSLSLNGSTLSNKITRMPIDPATGEPQVISINGTSGLAEGRSIYDFYVRDFVGVDPEDGRSMWKVYYTDNNGDGQFTAGEQIASMAVFDNPDGAEILEGTTKNYTQSTLHYVGKSSIPKLFGAFRLSGGYKGFDISTQFLYRLGGYAMDGAYQTLMHSGRIGGNNWHTDIANRWQQPGDITDVPRLSNATDDNASATSTRWLTKANYLVLNNIVVSYALPTSLVREWGLQGLSVWASGDNLWQKTARKGFYPMTAESGASSMYRYNPLSTIAFGVRAKF